MASKTDTDMVSTIGAKNGKNTTSQIKNQADHGRAATRNIVILFAIFLLYRILDVFWLELDDSLGDILLSKSLSFITLVFVLIFSGKQLHDIGLQRRHLFYNTLLGAGFALLSMLVLRLTYAAISGDWLVVDTADVTWSFVYFTFMTNVVNVMAEEGIFRGVFLRNALNTTRGHFWKANTFQAFLFGIWHWTVPLKGYTSDEMELGEALTLAVVYFVLTFSVAIIWGFYYYMTGSLFVPLTWHLLWNATLGIVPLASDNTLAYLVAFLLATAVGFSAIVFFDRFVPASKTRQIQPWYDI